MPREVKSVEGQRYIQLSAGDRQFARFVGVDPAGFAHSLREERNVAVDELIVAHLKKSDSMLIRVNHVSLAKARKQIDAADLNAHVVIHLPAVDGVDEDASVPAVDIKLLTEVARNRVVSVEATATALASVRAAALQRGADRKRTCSKMKTCEDATGVFCDKRRKHCYILWGPDDDQRRRISRKPEQWDQFHINLCAQELARDRDAGFPGGVPMRDDEEAGAERDDEEDGTERDDVGVEGALGVDSVTESAEGTGDGGGANDANETGKDRDDGRVEGEARGAAAEGDVFAQGA